MNDTKNEMQTNVNADYAGPPKAHNFQSNTNTSMPKMQPPPSKIQMPERTPENVLLNEDDVLLKNDDVSTTSAPSIDGTEADNELLKMIKHSEELEAHQNKKKVKVKKEPMFDWKKINFSQKWFEFRKKIVKFRKRLIEFRRKYKKVFNMLDILWGTVKFAFYCVGLSFFAFCSFFVTNSKLLLLSFISAILISFFFTF